MAGKNGTRKYDRKIGQRKKMTGKITTGKKWHTKK